MTQRHKLKREHKKDAKHEYYLRKHLEEADANDIKSIEAASGATKDDVKLQLDADPSEKLGGDVSSKEMKIQQLSSIHHVQQDEGSVQGKKEAIVEPKIEEPEVKKPKSKKSKKSDEADQDAIDKEVSSKKSLKKKNKEEKMPKVKQGKVNCSCLSSIN